MENNSEDDGSFIVISRESILDLPVLPETINSEENDEMSDLSLGGIERILSLEQSNLEMAQDINERLTRVLAIAASGNVTDVDSGTTAARELPPRVDATTMTDVPNIDEGAAIADNPHRHDEIVNEGPNEAEMEVPVENLNEIAIANRDGDGNAFPNFMQDYYQSLTSVSRYTILAVIIVLIQHGIILGMSKELNELKQKRGFFSGWL